METYIYIDYENLGNLKTLPKIEGKYFFFIGDNQNSIPKSLVLASNDNSVEWIEISGNGKNALDFHIAYFLAKNDEQKNVIHYILSKDKGFDPLISFINKQNNKKAKRIVSLDDILTTKRQEESTKNHDNQKNYDKVIKNLQGIAKIKRPKSEKKLKTHIGSFFHNELDNNEIQHILEDLYRKNIISKGNNNRISYSI